MTTPLRTTPFMVVLETAAVTVTGIVGVQLVELEMVEPVMLAVPAPTPWMFCAEVEATALLSVNRAMSEVQEVGPEPSEYMQVAVTA